MIIDDRVQGEYVQNLQRDVGDFIIRRGDGLVAYQLATVVDDAWQEITEVVRGADLLDSTPRQVYLQQHLGLPTPAYAHFPVVLDENGKKLGKRTMADPVAGTDGFTSLAASLRFLGHFPPDDISELDQLWRWAQDHWQIARVPTLAALPRFGSA